MSKSNTHNKSRHHFNGPVLDPKTVLAPVQRAGKMARPANRIDKKSPELPSPRLEPHSGENGRASGESAMNSGAEASHLSAAGSPTASDLSPTDHAAAERLAYLFALERGHGSIPLFDPYWADDDFRRAADVIRKQRALSGPTAQAG